MRYYLAQVYGEGIYGDKSYSCTENQQSSGVCLGANEASRGPGGLVDTGMAVLMITTIAGLILFSALIARLWRRRVPVHQKGEANQHKSKPNI